MKKLSTLTLAALIALSTLGAGTFAIASGKLPTIPNMKTSDAAAIAKSKISLNQAIIIAQKVAKGDLISAEFDQNDYGAGGKYEIKFVSNGMENEVKIDADTGKILKTKQEGMDQDDIEEYNAMKKSGLSLTQAMQQATKTIPGKIIEAEFDFDHGVPTYKIEIAQSSQVHKLVIDSNKGEVLSRQVKHQK